MHYITHYFALVKAHTHYITLEKVMHNRAFRIAITPGLVVYKGIYGAKYFGFQAVWYLYSNTKMYYIDDDSLLFRKSLERLKGWSDVSKSEVISNKIIQTNLGVTEPCDILVFG